MGERLEKLKDDVHLMCPRGVKINSDELCAPSAETASATGSQLPFEKQALSNNTREVLEFNSSAVFSALLWNSITSLAIRLKVGYLLE
jgi:hypothetical protein